MERRISGIESSNQRHWFMTSNTGLLRECSAEPLQLHCPASPYCRSPRSSIKPLGRSCRMHRPDQTSIISANGSGISRVLVFDPASSVRIHACQNQSPPAASATACPVPDGMHRPEPSRIPKHPGNRVPFNARKRTVTFSLPLHQGPAEADVSRRRSQHILLRRLVSPPLCSPTQRAIYQRRRIRPVRPRAVPLAVRHNEDRVSSGIDAPRSPYREPVGSCRP